MPSTRIRELLDRFRRVRLLVLGDAVLDAWLHAYCERIAREAPVPVHEIGHIDWVPGSAANAAANAAALGAEVQLVALVGADDAGRRLRRALTDRGVSTEGLVEDSTASTTTKGRLVVGGQVVTRFDTAPHPVWSADALSRLRDTAIDRLDEVDAVLVSDYGTDALPDSFVAEFCRERNRLHGPLVVDGHHFHRWDDCRVTAMTPSAGEVGMVPDHLPDHVGQTERIAQLTARSHELLHDWHCDMLLTTLDADGTLLHRFGRSPHRTRATATAPNQTCGAGDTLSAAFTVALAAGLAPDEAADLAQAAADVVVQKPGTSCCSADELERRCGDRAPGVTTLEQLHEEVEAHRAAGRRIVFTNGCFDILHAGHVEYLRQARALGDVLVVGLNSDASVRRLKGPDRPIVPETERAGMLAALRSVDHVALFDTQSPTELLQLVRPEVYVKGGDYSVAMLPEASLVERLGGRVVLVDYVAGRSTTQLVERIRGEHGVPPHQPADRTPVEHRR